MTKHGKDIALAKLASPIDNVPFVSIAQESTIAGIEKGNRLLTVGYGMKDLRAVSKYLREARLTVASNDGKAIETYSKTGERGDEVSQYRFFVVQKNFESFKS